MSTLCFLEKKNLMLRCFILRKMSKLSFQAKFQGFLFLEKCQELSRHWSLISVHEVDFISTNTVQEASSSSSCFRHSSYIWQMRGVIGKQIFAQRYTAIKLLASVGTPLENNEMLTVENNENIQQCSDGTSWLLCLFLHTRQYEGTSSQKDQPRRVLLATTRKISSMEDKLGKELLLRYYTTVYIFVCQEWWQFFFFSK